MKLHDQVPVLHPHEFIRWRETGCAFELRDTTYNVPNLTLSSSRLLRKDGRTLECRGYWGDISTSPYIAFGAQSDDQALFATANGRPTKTARDISEFNVSALIHEIQTGQRYRLADQAQSEKPPTDDSVTKNGTQEVTQNGNDLDQRIASTLQLHRSSSKGTL